MAYNAAIEDRVREQIAAALEVGDLSRAAQQLQGLLRSRAGDIDLCIGLAQVLVADGRTDRALTTIEAMPEYQTDTRLRQLAASIDATQGAHERGLARLEGLKDRESVWLRASMHLELGHPQVALMELEPLGTADSGILELALDAHLQLGHTDTVITTAQKMLELGTESVKPLVVLAEHELRQGKSQEVIDWLSGLPPQLASHPHLAVILAAAYTQTGALEDASVWKNLAILGVPRVFPSVLELQQYFADLLGHDKDG